MENAVCRAVTSLTGQQAHNLSRRVIAKLGYGCGLSEIKGVLVEKQFKFQSILKWLGLKFDISSSVSGSNTKCKSLVFSLIHLHGRRTIRDLNMASTEDDFYLKQNMNIHLDCES